MRQSFVRVSPLTPIYMTVAICLGFVVRSWRWKLLLPHGIPIGDSLGAIVLGYAANNVLPARLGEIVRAQAIGQKCKISRSLALASIFIERVLDGLVLTALLYLGIGSNPIPQWASSVGVLGLTLFGGALTAIFLLAITRLLWEPKLARLSSAKLRNVLEQFLKGLTLLWRTSFLPLTILGLSLTIWLIEGITYYIAIQAFELQVPQTAALFVMGLVNLGILIPSAPGYLGAFHYFGTLALSAWQIPTEEALVCIVVIHACLYLPTTIWGLRYIPYFGFDSLGKLSSKVR